MDLERTSGRRRRRKAERPAEILDAAFEEFIANGFEKTRLDDVADRAGITKGTIYLYFENKEGLFLACLCAAMKPILDHMEELSADPQGSAYDLLRQHLTFAADMVVRDRRSREVVRLVIGEGSRFPEIVKRWRSEFIDPIMHACTKIGRYGVERGEFRQADMSSFAHTILAPILLANTWLVVFGSDATLDVDAFFTTTLDIYASGLLMNRTERVEAQG